MKKLYKVRVPENMQDKNRSGVYDKDGYLCVNNIPQEYTRGEAVKKASMFNGKIEFSREVDYREKVRISIKNGCIESVHSTLLPEQLDIIVFDWDNIHREGYTEEDFKGIEEAFDKEISQMFEHTEI